MSDTEKSAVVATSDVDSAQPILKSGSLEYLVEHSGNGDLPTYQVATGAPVEHESPLGYQVNWIAIIALNIGQMIGTGVFSTPGSILASVGSVGLALIYWVIGFVVSACALSVYLELASYFPGRSGAEVVYLEQAYPKPKYFFPVAFAVQSVLLSFSSSNAIVLAQYLFRMTETGGSDWAIKGVAVAAYSLAVGLLILNNRLALHLSNVFGAIKVLTLIFVSITGLVVLGGHTSITPTGNFDNAFAGTTATGNGLATAAVRITFAYAGYQNAFNVMAEVKNPVRTIKRSAPLSLLIVAILYMLCNIAYFAAVPKEDISTANEVTAALFFKRVFGDRAAKGLNFLVVMSAFGNLISVLIGQSRLLREIARQGLLPFPRFFASTKPFGTPLGPYLLKLVATVIMIVAPPAGDAFSFAVDLQTYPDSIFLAAMFVGLFLIRRQRTRLGLGKPAYRSWTLAVIVALLLRLFLLVMPFVPPKGGIYAGDVSFFYATYVLVGIAIIIICGIYYMVWIHWLPKWRGYRVEQEVLVLDDGAVTHQLVRRPLVAH